MRIVITGLIMSFCLSMSAQHDWVFKKEKDGIKAYTRKVDGSGIDEYKVTTRIKGSIESFVGVVQDMDIYTDIFDDTEEASIVHKEGDHTIELLIKTGVPFPFKDRYSYARTDYTFDSSPRTVSLDINCLDNATLQKIKGGIKVTNCKGGWIVTQHDNESIEIEHFFHVDPEGVVPAWIINKMTIEGPIKSINKIKKYIVQDRYQGLKFDFIKS